MTKSKGIRKKQQWRKKISEAKKGKPLSVEHRKAISEALKGKPSNFKGKKHTWESRMKHSISMINTERKPGWREGIPRSPEDKRKISEGVKRYYRNLPKVLAYTRERIQWSDPYNYEKRVKKVLELFENANIPEENKELLKKYCLYSQSIGKKPGTIYKDISALWRLFKQYPKKFTEMTKKDIEKIIIDISLAKNSGTGEILSPAYKSILKTAIRNFFKFLDKPEVIDWIKVKAYGREEQHLDLDDIKKVIESVNTFEEKVFLSLLWESCCRTGEILNLGKQDIKFFKYKGVEGAYLSVKGKTGFRTVVILNRKNSLFPLGSYEMLKEYLKIIKDRPNLWSFKNYNQIEYRFRKLRKELKMKNLHAHLFRKSRATYLDMIGTPLQHICLMGGWVINSRVVNTYIRTSGRHLLPILIRQSRVLELIEKNGRDVL
jgi:integrase